MTNDPRELSDDDRRPLYEQVKEVLRNEIAEGHYRPDEPFISQQKVCVRFGVSAITAIRALNDLAAEGILIRRPGRGTFVAESVGLDNHRNGPAATPRGAATLACVTPGIDSLHVAGIVSGVEAVCAELGYHLTLMSSVNEPSREEQALARAIDGGMSGVVVYPAHGATRPGVYERLRRAHIPVVMVDRYRPELATDVVTVDHSLLARELTTYLVERGHHSILTTWGETECTSCRDRLAGHVEALRQHGIQVRSRLTVLRPYGSMPEAERQAKLAEMLQLSDAPTAVLCSDGYTLARTAQDLITLGVGVPDEIELAAMDDSGAYGMLPLAAVAGILPSEEMGRRATDVLVRRMASDDPYRDPGRIVLPVRIRTRESAVGYLRTARTGKVEGA